MNQHEVYFYAVKIGRNPGIYSSAKEYELQIAGYPNSEHKKFKNKLDAYEYIIRESNSNIDTEEISPIKNLNESPTSSIKSKKRELESDPTINSSESKKIKNHNDAVSISVSAENYADNINEDDFSFDGQDVEVYTDGSCKNNGRNGAKGGIGVWWGHKHCLNKSLKLEDGNKTNNRAEFRAAIVAIQLGIKHKAGSLTINTDSDLLIKTITIYKNDWKRRGWKKSSKGPIANLDEVKILDSLCSKIKVKWNYVPGHSGIFGNDEADRLAHEATE